MTRPDWVPEGIDTAQPSAARIYDYWLGGTHNVRVDREAARFRQAPRRYAPVNVGVGRKR